MTDRIAEEIRKALDAATPGPWEVTNLGDVHITKDYRMVDGRHIAMWIADMYVDRENEDQIFADAHLIANAPEWLGFLLDELERLEREYAEERAAHNEHVAELCELEKENRRLREDIEKIIKILKNGQPAHWQAFKIRQLLGVTME
jgi:Glu-tRNA(Gln) amidotransferase subunit E-like FAD-binding protein